MPLVKTKLGRRTPTIATNQMGSPGPGSRVAGSFAERSAGKQQRLLEMQGAINTGRTNVANINRAAGLDQSLLRETGAVGRTAMQYGQGSPSMIAAKSGAERSRMFQTPIYGEGGFETGTAMQRYNPETGRMEMVQGAGVGAEIVSALKESPDPRKLFDLLPDDFKTQALAMLGDDPEGEEIYKKLRAKRKIDTAEQRGPTFGGWLKQLLKSPVERSIAAPQAAVPQGKTPFGPGIPPVSSSQYKSSPVFQNFIEKRREEYRKRREAGPTVNPLTYY